MFVEYNWRLCPTSMQTEQIFEVFLAAFLPQGRSTSEQLLAYFHKKLMPRLAKGQLVCMASNEKRIIGFAIFEKWDEASYYLAEMAVLPECQKHGIGRKLVFSILEKDPAVDRIRLITEKGNAGAQSFYKKIGCEPSSFRHPDYPTFVGYEFVVKSGSQKH